MRVVLQDGRVFEGTAVQIVQAMQSIAFDVEGLTLSQYMEWVADNALRMEGVELRPQGATEEEWAKSLVEEMVRTGLARRG